MRDGRIGVASGGMDDRFRDVPPLQLHQSELGLPERLRRISGDLPLQDRPRRFRITSGALPITQGESERHFYHEEGRGISGEGRRNRQRLQSPLYRGIEQFGLTLLEPHIRFVEEPERKLLRKSAVCSSQHRSRSCKVSGRDPDHHRGLPADNETRRERDGTVGNHRRFPVTANAGESSAQIIEGQRVSGIEFHYLCRARIASSHRPSRRAT